MREEDEEMKEARVAIDSAAGEDSSDEAEIGNPGGVRSEDDDDGKDNIPATGELRTDAPASPSASLATVTFPWL